MEAIIAIIGTFGVVPAIVWAGSHYKHKTQQAHANVLIALADKGEPITPEIIESLGVQKTPKNHDLRRGVILIALAIDASRAWLFQIAYRSYVDHVRKDVRRRELGERQAPPTDDLRLAPTGLQLDIERAMNKLGDDCRAVVILCLAYGFSHSEAAQATNMALGTVKSHVARMTALPIRSCNLLTL